MLHGIGDSFRDSAGKFLDTALGICRDTFIIIFSFHYRHHQIKRQKHSEDIEARTSALESAVFKPNESGRELLANAKGAAAGQAVDLHSNGNDSVLPDRHWKP